MMLRIYDVVFDSGQRMQLVALSHAAALVIARELAYDRDAQLVSCSLQTEW